MPLWAASHSRASAALADTSELTRPATRWCTTLANGVCSQPLVLLHTPGTWLLIMHVVPALCLPNHQFKRLSCRRLIEERAATNRLLEQQLGAPLSTGKWYNSSVGVSHGGFIATATIAVVGSRNSSDVIINVRERHSSAPVDSSSTHVQCKLTCSVRILCVFVAPDRPGVCSFQGCARDPYAKTHTLNGI